jgi:SAM-dependent methyltransferase
MKQLSLVAGADTNSPPGIVHQSFTIIKHRPWAGRSTVRGGGMGANVGTGPGEITPDGRAVEFYALLPAMGEAPIVHSVVPEGGSILELGCGTGRILRPLSELGHPVLGADESPAMLARAADLPTVCSPIETLRLDRVFDAVLVASTMINTEPAQRRAFLATCGSHVGRSGVVAANWRHACAGRPVRAGRAQRVELSLFVDFEVGGVA